MNGLNPTTTKAYSYRESSRNGIIARKSDEEFSCNEETLLYGVLFKGTYYPKGKAVSGGAPREIPQFTRNNIPTMGRANSEKHLIHVSRYIFSKTDVCHHQILEEHGLLRVTPGDGRALVTNSKISLLSHSTRVTLISTLRTYCKEQGLPVPCLQTTTLEDCGVVDETEFEFLNEEIKRHGVSALPPFLRSMYTDDIVLVFDSEQSRPRKRRENHDTVDPSKQRKRHALHSEISAEVEAEMDAVDFYSTL